jgi:hypothetical protein
MSRIVARDGRIRDAMRAMIAVPRNKGSESLQRRASLLAVPSAAPLQG